MSDDTEQPAAAPEATPEPQPAAPAPAPAPAPVTQPRARTDGMAIACLVLGILGFFTCVTAPVGLVLGIISLGNINRSRGRLEGRGLAIAGIVTSATVVAVLLIAALIAILVALTAPLWLPRRLA